MKAYTFNTFLWMIMIVTPIISFTLIPSIHKRTKRLLPLNNHEMMTNQIEDNLHSKTKYSYELEIHHSFSSKFNQKLYSSLFDTLAYNALMCLFQSDLKRLSCNDGASTGWTSWVDAISEEVLRNQFNDLLFYSTHLANNNNNNNNNKHETKSQLNQDKMEQWLRWMRTCPAPVIADISEQLRHSANQNILENDLLKVDCTREQILDRMGCRIILLPSGQSLNQSMKAPPGAMIFGKLLYGGVTRYRLLSGGKRRTGERSVIMPSSTSISTKTNEDDFQCWLQFGGPERNYEALDMGPAALMELILLPKGLSISDMSIDTKKNQMEFTNIPIQMKSMFFSLSDQIHSITDTDRNQNNISNSTSSLVALYGKDRNDALQTSLAAKVGGLQTQIETIVRRVLDGRIIFDDNSSLDNSDLSILEAEELNALGLQPVRGLLLYGKPGNGKTALVREIARVLNARPPKIVAAPELLDRWVGGSERLVRELFQPAEDELLACNGDPMKSALHIIVIDEIDAVFRKRSVSQDSGESTRNSVVNQILAKMDGINSIPNVIVIGMTNRRELLDDALLRPGRLEVQIEIPVPDKEGRRDIFQIHFQALRQRGRLSKPLCEAIDGVSTMHNKDIRKRTRWMRRFQNVIKFLPLTSLPIVDLADDAVTGGFSGADIAGLVRCAGSIALARARQNGSSVNELLITLDDVKNALVEVRK